MNFLELKENNMIIAEVGQNHQGDFDTALEYISVFAQCGANAIKFQTRDNHNLFSQAALEKPYDGYNSFGKTYGEHREKLELDPGRLHELAKECKLNNVKFMSTPFEEKSLEKLLKAGVEILKVASFDLGNLPLIQEIAKTKLPTVMSIGGGKSKHVRESHDIIVENGNSNLAILHCVSEYPCNYDRLGLDNIPRLKEIFPDTAIGLSDHFNGILSGPIAYMLGARIFEKHVTFNRSNKGTDHSFALEAEGFRKFCRDINRVNKMMRPKSELDLGNEPVFAKLGKSIAAACHISKGQKLELRHFRGIISDEQIIPIREVVNYVGKKATRDVNAGDILDGSFFK